MPLFLQESALIEELVTKDVDVYDRDSLFSSILSEEDEHEKLKLWRAYIALYKPDDDEVDTLLEDLADINTDNSEQLTQHFYRSLLSYDRSTKFYVKLIQHYNTPPLNEYKAKFLDEIFLQALTYTEFDFLNSHKVSLLFIEHLQRLDRQHQIKEHYLRRLKVPHLTLDETFQSYVSFSRTFDADNADSEIAIASKIYNQTKKNQFDLELRYVRKPDQGLTEYWNDILDSTASVPKKQRNIFAVIAAFENGYPEIQTTEFCEKFIQILYLFQVSNTDLEYYLSRFIASFPSSPLFHIEYLRNLTCFQNADKIYDTLLHKLDRLENVDFETWKDITIGRLSFLLWSVKYDSDSSRLDELHSLSNESFEKSLNHEDNTFHSVERFIANAYENLGSIETARTLLRKLTQNYPTESEGWLISYYFEKRHNNDNAFKVLKAAVSVSESLDWPERIFEEALKFAQVTGDIDLYRFLTVKISEKEKIIQELRESQMEIEAEAEVEAENVSTKRKAEDDEIEDDFTHKKATASGHRERENLTVAVRGIQPTISEKQIRHLFRDCGLINELRVFEVSGSIQCNIEFTNLKDLQKALTKDYKKLGGKEIRVEKLASTIWVTNYPASYVKNDFEKLFGEFGEIVSIRLPSLMFNSQRRFCYVEFAKSESAKAAVDSLDGKIIDSLKLVVKISDPSSKKVRSGATEEGREVYVSKLDFYKVTANKVKQLFSKFGDVENVHLPLSEQNRAQGKKHDGYGFVVFKTVEQAQASLELNLVSLEGRIIEVSISQKKSQKLHKQEVSALRDYSNADNVVAVKNLSDKINSEQLKTFFSTFGDVTSVILEPSFNGAIIEFKNQSDAAKASLSANGQKFQDSTIQITTVKELKRKSDAPARRKIGLVPSSLRKQLATLDIKRPSPAKTESSTQSSTESNTEPASNNALKSNADFRKMFLGL